MRGCVFAFFLLCLLVPRLAEAKALALIVGNQSYEKITPLQKAKADAEGYAALFQSHGFAVTLAHDLPRAAMLETLAQFYEQIEPGDTVVFAYSGHGWSDGQQNYLLPTDIRGTGSQAVLAGESFVLRNGANGILDQIDARSPQLVVAIIDACRDNPFAADPLTRSAGLSRGLVRMQPPSGTFIAFSAGEGQTALDRLSDEDPSPYSVFTRVFLGELALPQDLQSAFKTTQARVNAIAQTIGHPQRPAYYDEVVGAACLDPRCRVEADADDLAEGSVTPVGIGADRTGAEDPSAVAAREWQDFRDTRSAEALEAFARRHEGTVYAILARARIAELQNVPSAETASPAPAPSDAPEEPQIEASDTVNAEAGDGHDPGTGIGAVTPPSAETAAGKPPKSISTDARRPGRPRPQPDRTDGADRPSPAGTPVLGAPPLAPGGAGRAKDNGEVAAQPWCAFATEPAEQTVCTNPRLAALHLKVDAMMQARHAALDPEGRLALLQSHRVWLRDRNTCGANPACIEDFLHARIEALGRSVWRAATTPPARL